MPTLAELRARKAALPKASETVTLVEGQHLLEESRQLTAELAAINRRLRSRGDDEEPTGPPLKSSAKVPDRVGEIEARAEAIRDELAESQGVVGLTGMSGGEWQRWKNEHPPREDSKDDAHYAFGVCNFSALFADLGRFVSSWEGEALEDGAWDSWLGERVCYADRRDLVAEVVRMQETRLPKAESISSETGNDETD